MAEKATEAYDRYAVPGAEKDDEVSKPKDEEAPPIDAHDTMLSNPSDSDADESSESKNSDQKKGRYCSVQYLVIYYVLVLLVVGAAVLLPLYFFTNALFERHNSPKTSSSVSEAASSETSGSGTGGSLPEPAPAGNSDLPKSAAPSMTPNPTEGIPVLSSVPVPGESTIRFLSELNYTSGNLGNGTSGTMMDNNMTGMSTEGSLPTSLAPDTESPGTLIDVLASLEIESDAPTPATSVTVPDSPTPNHATAWKPWTLPIPALATSLSAASPTMAPTTDAPSALPTDGPIDATKTPLFSYLVALGTPEETLADEMTPQGKAIRWLLQEDISQISVFRIPQRYALVSLDFVLHDDSGDDHWRDVTEDFCNWQGVTCDSLEDVIGIKWNRQGLTGTMIPEIVHLSKLKTLDLASNNIEGGLDYFWDLEYLTHMYLFENRFSGAIPDRPAPRGLKKVYLGHNQLTGSIPLTLASSDEGPEELGKEFITIGTW